MKKYIFVTGGVVSGLGKGITASSIALLLKAKGYKVFMQKFDPYINVDPGTMNPIQHGEVFVTDDNPRFEDADTIREEIMAACPKGVNIKDRAKAIKIAIDSLHQGDVLVLAGKGHESGQYVKGEILPFSDHEEAAKNLENR